MKILVIAGAVLLVLLAAWLLFRPRGPQEGEIAPAGELQKKYKLDAEHRPVIRLEPKKVPAKLRDLIPLAEKWGIGDDIIRYDFEKKSPQADKDELVRWVAGRYDEIDAWLKTHRAGEMSDEMAAFMYMMTACEEVRPLPPKQPGK
jgi:hypothetical protein